MARELQMKTKNDQKKVYENGAMEKEAKSNAGNHNHNNQQAN